MKVIGLTGCIGSGKSTVLRFLAELGAVIIDADVVGHEAFTPGTDVWRDVVAAFGRQVLKPDGEIDRHKLGRMVFDNPENRSLLDRLTHPRLYNIVHNRIEDCRQRGCGVVVLEAPLLIEAGWETLVDEVWVTVTSEKAMIKRLQDRNGLSEEEVRTRIRSQLPAWKKIEEASAVIENNGTWSELKKRVGELWQRLDNG